MTTIVVMKDKYQNYLLNFSDVFVQIFSMSGYFVGIVGCTSASWGMDSILHTCMKKQYFFPLLAKK